MHDKDQSEETEDQALISAITFLSTKPDPCFLFKSLALQDYSHKASDDEPRMVPFLDIEA